MSGVDINFINTILSFVTYDDLITFDTSGLKAGAIAFVREGIADVDAPVNTDRPSYIYSPTSVAALSSPTVLETGNSDGATYAGRWLRITGAPITAP